MKPSHWGQFSPSFLLGDPANSSIPDTCEAPALPDLRSHDPSETLPEPPRSLTPFAHGGVRRAGAPSAQARVPECVRCRAGTARRRNGYGRGVDPVGVVGQAAGV